MRFSEAVGRQVVSTSTADTVGKLDEFIVDPQQHAIIALKLKKKTDAGDTLPWPSITAFGVDAITVAGAELVTPADSQIEALSGKHHQLIGSRTLTTGGDDIGKVSDVEFDPETGIITAVILSSGEVEGVRLVGVGSYAVVVQAQ